jgi:broad specificity phosphatase PhoE
VHDLLIIRHGQSEWNVERRWQGWKDAPLTELGISQARHRAETLAESGFAPEVVVSSDLGRARLTAEIIAGRLGAPARTDPGFRERCGGDWEGWTVEEIEAQWPAQLAAWRDGDRSLPPGSEDDAVVLARFDAAITAVLSGPRPAVIVTHGGILHLVASRAGVDVHTLIPNLAGFWFETGSGALSRPEPIAPLPEATDLPQAE